MRVIVVLIDHPNSRLPAVLTIRSPVVYCRRFDRTYLTETGGRRKTVTSPPAYRCGYLYYYNGVIIDTHTIHRVTLHDAIKCTEIILGKVDIRQPVYEIKKEISKLTDIQNPAILPQQYFHTLTQTFYKRYICDLSEDHVKKYKFFGFVLCVFNNIQMLSYYNIELAVAETVDCHHTSLYIGGRKRLRPKFSLIETFVKVYEEQDAAVEEWPHSVELILKELCLRL